MNTQPSAPMIRLATPEDIALIERLDSFSSSPTRDIHRAMEQYFGSIDPSTHEHTFIFLMELDSIAAAKAELMVPAPETINGVGYIKRVIVHPDFRGRRLSKLLLEHIIAFARDKHQLSAVDLHVWDQNRPAIRLYEGLGFQLRHRELYYRLPLS